MVGYRETERVRCQLREEGTGLSLSPDLYPLTSVP